MKLNLRAQSRYLQRKKSAMLGAKGLWDGSIKILPNLNFYSRFTKKVGNQNQSIHAMQLLIYFNILYSVFKFDNNNINHSLHQAEIQYQAVHSELRSYTTPCFYPESSSKISLPPYNGSLIVVFFVNLLYMQFLPGCVHKSEVKKAKVVEL